MASPTATAQVPDVRTSHHQPGPRAWWATGWVPAAAVLVATAATLHWYGVSARDLAAFGLYSVVAGTLPGTLLWRALLGHAGVLATDLAAGTAVGFAVEIPVYLIARYAGVPLAVLAWPVVTFAAFLAVPRLRRYWRGSGDRLPIGIAWGLAGFALYFLAYSAITFLRIEAVSGPAANSLYVDMPFQIALVGELKYHFPATMPFVTGTPLQYHWYVHAHAAAASWVTGIAPETLVLRLLPVPMIGAFIVLIAATGRALTGRWWPGLLALCLVSVITLTNPLHWTAGPFVSGSVLDGLWFSPTQIFGAVLFAALILLLVDLLGSLPHLAVNGSDLLSSRPDLSGSRSTGRIGSWIAVTLLTGAVAGAKATFLPMLVCGILLALGVALLARRHTSPAPGAAPTARHRISPALTALGITLGWLAFAQLGLYGGGDQGLVVAPLATVKWTVLGEKLLGLPSSSNPWPTLAALTLLNLIAWGLSWAGAVGLLRRTVRADPAHWLVAGIGVVGVGASFAFGHPGLSQLYFMASGRPYLAIATAAGFAALLTRSADGRRGLVALSVLAAALGVVALYAIRDTVGLHEPTGADLLGHFEAPYAVLLGTLGVLAVAIVAVARAVRIGRRGALLAVLVMITASTVPAAVDQTTNLIGTASTGPMRDVAFGPAAIPPGGIKAARWLRTHSSPGDLVATNDHCRYRISACDSRDFWVSAFAQRRVLVEGWSYTDRAMESLKLYRDGLGSAGYWDPVLLAANDAAFQHPSTGNVARLSYGYGVRWLVAVGPAASPDLARYATLRYTAGIVSVYQLYTPS